jgi:hypothetical protein
MNDLTLNAIAIGIFAMTLSIVLGPFLNISPALSSGVIILVLGAITFDSFRFQSLGLTLFLDTLARQSTQYRKRIVHHEAGHFLVAVLLDLPIQSYTLSVWDAIQQGHPQQAGLVLDQPDENTLNQAWIKANIEKLCTVWVAGGIAEDLQYGSIQGNADDLRQLRGTLRQLGLNVKLYERQAQQKARHLLHHNWQCYQTLIPLLEQQQPLSECLTVIRSIEQSL